MDAGTLYVVSTPIGNLGDLTFRAVEVLRAVDLILAEDTRHARTLLARYEVRTRTASYHEHNESRTTPALLGRLLAGENLALITDAGTPLLSDPGARLVAAAVDAGVRVEPVPGASALLAALVASGIPLDRFTFFGFLPRHGQARAEAVGEVAALPHAAVLYEAPARAARTLADLAAAGDPGRPAVVARELTKRFEEFRRGTLGELAAYYADSPPRGEVVIIVGAPPVGAAPALDEVALRNRVQVLRSKGMARRDIVAALVAEAGVPRNVAYRMAHETAHESTTADAADES
jgi:16S rRNA (cytidine1402-2'-O)-methyltransferase